MRTLETRSVGGSVATSWPFSVGRGRNLWASRVACWILVLFAACAVMVRGQETADSGIVSGVVVESGLGRPLSGVTVLVRGLTVATTTDVEGRYTLKGVPAGLQVVTFSRSGYVRAVITEIRVAVGQVSKVDVPLRPEYYEMEEYEVTAEELKEQEVELLSARQKSAAVSDAIGSETFSRYASSDAADIMTKVAGASVVDGKFAVIRGLSDRYTSATMNGAEIPSADPYRKAAQLDLFPAMMIDQMVVTKSFTPDQPGSYTGGAMNIITRAFPEKFTFSISAGSGYNENATFNDNFLSSHGGSHDWAAMDSGARAMPDGLGNIPTPPRNALRGDGPEEAAARQAQADRLDRLTRSFESRQFAPTRDEAPLNQSYSASIGDTLKLADRPFGYLVGVSYKREYNMYEDGRSDRYTPDLQPRYLLSDARSIEETSWGTIAGLSYELHPNHELGFNFLYNQFAEDMARHREGKNLTTGSPEQTLIQEQIHYTERNLNAYQFRGKHELPALKNFRIDWLASLANTTQEEPDVRFFNYYRAPDGNGGWVNRIDNSVPEPVYPTRYFRDLDEDNGTFKVDGTLPFQQWSGLRSELKGGAYYSTSERTFDERTYSFRGDAPFSDPNTFIPTGRTYDTVVNSRGQTNYIFNRYVTSELGNSVYEGSLDVIAGYLMTEIPVVQKLKVVGGARIETTDLEVTGSNPIDPEPVTAEISEIDVLPAVGLVYSLTTNMNVRFNFGQTIARPTFREIAPYRSFDPVESYIIEGNPDLEKSSIDNFDLRWEWFPRPGEVLAVSAFYKDLELPIEKYSPDNLGDTVTWINRDNAIVYGLEFEARKNLDFIGDIFTDFSLGANIAWIESEVELTDTELANKRQYSRDVDSTRPLYDQSPYIINLDLTYANAKSGTTATLAANLAAERIYLVRNVGPDIYEHPPTMLDFILSQKIGNNWKVKFSAKNLLDPDYKRTYGDDPNGVVYSSYTKGRTYAISVSYDF